MRKALSFAIITSITPDFLTLFNALTGSQAETGSYTNAAAKPNIGTAKVPDERLDWLAAYYHPKKYTPATIEFVDVPGVAAGGKGREVFQAIRMVDALVEVVRCFDDDSVFLEKADAVPPTWRSRSAAWNAQRKTPRAATKNISAKWRCARR